MGIKPTFWVFLTPFLPLADKFIDQHILFISDLQFPLKNMTSERNIHFGYFGPKHIHYAAKISAMTLQYPLWPKHIYYDPKISTMTQTYTLWPKNIHYDRNFLRCGFSFVSGRLFYPTKTVLVFIHRRVIIIIYWNNFYQINLISF